MQNERTKNERTISKHGIIQDHINNNLRNYIIITIIFIARGCDWSFIHK